MFKLTKPLLYTSQMIVLNKNRKTDNWGNKYKNKANFTSFIA